jgi:hypothetical protein
LVPGFFSWKLNPDWSLGLRYEKVYGKKYAFSGTSQPLIFENHSSAMDTKEKRAKLLTCDADGVN